MKRLTFSLLFLVMAVVVFGSWSWATCPEAPTDNGICDTLRVTTPDAVQTGAGPYTVRFPLWITHDVPNPVDSIAAIVIPLCFTQTNPTKYCSVSSYWNKILWTGSNLPRSIFRHLVIGTDTTHNWMMDLFNAELGEEWNTIILDFTSGTPNHFWLAMVPTGSEDPRFGPGNHVLMAMMTFAIQDTMHVTIDTCLWPPSSPISFARSDAVTYVPRDNMPTTFWIGPPLWVTAPNGGEIWAVGTTHNITWGSEGFAGAKVKIQYSIDSGTNWISVVDSTLNTGSYPWLIPNNPSTNCRVKVSGLTGDPHDSSDADFTIEQPPPPDFSLAATPDTQTVAAGDSTNYTVNLGALNGFSNPVTLSMNIIGSSLGISSVFSPDTVTPPGSSTMKVRTTGETSPATYKLIVTGTYNSLVHKDTVTLIVTPAPNFTIDATPDTQQVIAGNDTSYKVILLSQNGFSNPCTLTTSGLPAGADAVFDINPVTPSDTAIMSVSTTLGVTPAGTYMITITATEQTKIQKSTNVYLVVNVPDFTIDATPETLAIRQGEQGDYHVALAALNGFSSSCSLSVTGLPANVTGAFKKITLVPPGTDTLTITADLSAIVNKYPLVITGTQLLAKGSVLAHSDTVLLDLRSQKDFELAVAPETLRIELGEDSSYKVKLTSVSGFNSPCSLSVSSLPANVTGSFNSHILTPTDSTLLNIMVSCNANTTETPFALTITATELSAKGIQKTKQVYLSIDLGHWGFKFATSPDTQRAVVGDSAIYQILIRRTTCFTLACTLSLESGLPGGATCYFSPPVIPSSDSTSKLVVNSGTAPAGISKLIIIGTATPKVIKDTLFLVLDEPSDVETGLDNPNTPKTFTLFQNQPNPFNPITQISYYLPKASRAKLTIYNVLGQSVRVLYDGYQEAGMQTITWDGRNSDGVELSSGIYFYRLQAGDFNQTKKMSLMK